MYFHDPHDVLNDEREIDPQLRGVIVYYDASDGLNRYSLGVYCIACTIERHDTFCVYYFPSTDIILVLRA